MLLLALKPHHSLSSQPESKPVLATSNLYAADGMQATRTFLAWWHLKMKKGMDNEILHPKNCMWKQCRRRRKFSLIHEYSDIWPRYLAFVFLSIIILLQDVVTQHILSLSLNWQNVCKQQSKHNNTSRNIDEWKRIVHRQPHSTKDQWSKTWNHAESSQSVNRSSTENLRYSSSNNKLWILHLVLSQQTNNSQTPRQSTRHIWSKAFPSCIDAQQCSLFLLKSINQWWSAQAIL